jgi:microcystin-dependent protein
MDVYLGMIFLFGGNFAPVNFAFCNGQLLQINANQALYSLLGTTYGGNGQTTFGLPDLRGRVPIGMGQGTGLSNYTLGTAAGKETQTLLAANLPAHTHNLMGDSTAGGHQYPGPNHVLGSSSTATNGIYSSNAPNTPMKASSIAPTGNSAPFSIQQPYLVLNYIIATSGIYPSRN